MIPFFDFSVVEKISVDAVKHNFIAMKVDYMKGVVLFGNMVSFTLYISFWNCRKIEHVFMQFSIFPSYLSAYAGEK